MFLIERQEQLSKLHALFVRSRSGRGQVALLTGSVASGKTAVLTALGEQVTASGGRFLRASGSRTERKLPFAVVEQLFHGAQLPERIAQHVSALLRGCALSGSSGDPAALISGRLQCGDQVRAQVLQETFSVLVELADTQPLVLAVDDIGHADPESLHCLLYLARRLGSARIMLVVTDSLRLQPAYPLFRAELIRHPFFTTLILPPLSAGGVTETMKALLGPASAGLGDDCFTVTGGNPLLVHAVINDQAWFGEVPDSPAGIVIGDDFTHAVAGCLHRLDDAVRRVARGLAVLTGTGEAAGPTGAAGAALLPDPALIGQLLDITPELVTSAVRLLETSGLVSAGRPRHFRIREAILDDMPAAERRAMHQRAAELLHGNGAPVGAIAAHLVDAAGTDAAWAVPVLRDAAADALASGAPAVASACLRLAQRSSTGRRDRVLITAMQVRAQWQMSSLAVAGQLGELTEAARASLMPTRDVLAIVPYLLWYGRSEDAAECLSQAAASLDRLSAQAATRLRAVATLTSWFSPDQHAGEPVPAGLAASASVSPGASPQLQAVMVLERALLGPAGTDIGGAEQILQRCELEHAAFGPAAAALAALIFAGRADRAAIWADLFLRHPSLRGVPVWHAILRAIRAEAARRIGDLAVAEEYARAALAAMPKQAWGVAIGIPLATLLLAATETGHLEEAAPYLAVTVPDTMLHSPLGLLYLRARGRYHVATGRYQAALSDFLSCGELMTRRDLEQPVLMPWRLELARVQICLGQKDAAAQLAREQIEVGVPDGTTYALALRLLAATVPGHQRITLLKEAVNILQAGDDRVELAHALADLGQAMHAQGDPSRARMMTTRAYQLAHVSGAQLLCGSLLLDQPGIGPVATYDSAPDDAASLLSDAERRVAALAAQGHTNREIAGKLFITVSTVEQHLTRIYKKLDIKRRVDLPMGLAEVSESWAPGDVSARVPAPAPVALPVRRLTAARQPAAASYGGRA